MIAAVHRRRKAGCRHSGKLQNPPYTGGTDGRRPTPYSVFGVRLVAALCADERWPGFDGIVSYASGHCAPELRSAAGLWPPRSHQ
jgi:hypothetical protein